jgi:hypothetical protein
VFMKPLVEGGGRVRVGCAIPKATNRRPLRGRSSDLVRLPRGTRLETSALGPQPVTHDRQQLSGKRRVGVCG